ncbi:hypothetical protein [Candidatus Clostridium radicumherbarum]|uniref:DUF4013 domain-containing protein n=1 Tax=Candidatus Clostridium radicumherbarum TaxID=3381662 RepID=A0ABW8TQ54_9CLOT
MSISERFSNGCRFIAEKILWIIIIPIALDLTNLLSWEKIYHTAYNPLQKIFMIKLGFIGAPPSVNYLLEDFPAPLFKYDSSGFSGILNRFGIFNVSFFITVILILSFLHSGYMSIVGSDSEEKASRRDFFIKGNKNWHKFFLLDCIIWFPLLLMVFNKNFILLSFVSVIFVYVQYSFVKDEVGIKENFKLGIKFLFNNLGLTVKLAIYLGLIFSLLSLIIFPLTRLGNVGVIIDIVICAYLGTGANRLVLEVYSADENDINVSL